MAVVKCLIILEVYLFQY